MMRLAKMPAEWLNGDRDALYALLEKLMARRRRVPDLIEDCRRASIQSVSELGGIAGDTIHLPVCCIGSFCTTTKSVAHRIRS